jgi:hypothetical protein
LYAENVIHRVHRKEENKYFMAAIMIKFRRLSSLINNGSVKKGKERIVEIKRERGLNEGREEIGEKGLWKEKWKKIIFFFVFLTPYALFSFFITTHIPIVGETNPPFTITLL